MFLLRADPTSDLSLDFAAWVFGVKRCQLAQHLPRAFVMHVRRFQRYFNDLISARIFTWIMYALISQPDFF